MTETRVAPIAYRISTPNRSVSTGVRTTPPPSPVSAPSSPARSDAPPMSTLNSRRFHAPFIGLEHGGSTWGLDERWMRMLSCGGTRGRTAPHGSAGGPAKRFLIHLSRRAHAPSLLLSTNRRRARGHRERRPHPPPPLHQGPPPSRRAKRT